MRKKREKVALAPYSNMKLITYLWAITSEQTKFATNLHMVRLKRKTSSGCWPQVAIHNNVGSMEANSWRFQGLSNVAWEPSGVNVTKTLKNHRDLNFLHPLGLGINLLLGGSGGYREKPGKKTQKSHEDPGATRKRNSWVKTQDSRMSSN